MTEDNELEIILEEPEPSRGLKIFGAVIWVGLTLIIFISVTFTLAQVWPYNNASIELTSDIESDTYTSDGVPVVYPDELLEYTADLCNYGVDIYATWWLDSYGPVLPGTGNLDIPARLRSNSEQIRSTIFYQRQNLGCIQDVEVITPIPVETQTGIYYSLRTENKYQPNPLTEVNNVVETNVFYYAEEGQEIP